MTRIHIFHSIWACSRWLYSSISLEDGWRLAVDKNFITFHTHFDRESGRVCTRKRQKQVHEFIMQWVFFFLSVLMFRWFSLLPRWVFDWRIATGELTHRPGCTLSNEEWQWVEQNNWPSSRASFLTINNQKNEERVEWELRWGGGESGIRESEGKWANKFTYFQCRSLTNFSCGFE